MSSKYDVIKLKVCLPGDHFYILSRFQLSRMLTFCKVPELHAIEIALDVKRHFVNQGQIETTQQALTHTLQEVMRQYGYCDHHGRLLPVITSFYAERIPLIILVGGRPRTGKTTMAQVLASRLNCTTVVNTEVLKDIADAMLPEEDSPVAGESTTSWWQRQCHKVYTAAAAEIDATLANGKVLIVEGNYLDLSLYSQYLCPHDARDSQDGDGIVMGVLLEVDPESTLVTLHWGQQRSQADDGERSRLESCAHETAISVDNCTPPLYSTSGACEIGVEHRFQGELRVLTNSNGAAVVHRHIVADSQAGVVLWRVRMTTIECLPAATDTLHVMAVDRILSALHQRGCLDTDTYNSLRSV